MRGVFMHNHTNVSSVFILSSVAVALSMALIYLIILWKQIRTRIEKQELKLMNLYLDHVLATRLLKILSCFDQSPKKTTSSIIKYIVEYFKLDDVMVYTNGKLDKNYLSVVGKAIDRDMLRCLHYLLYIEKYIEDNKESIAENLQKNPLMIKSLSKISRGQTATGINKKHQTGMIYIMRINHTTDKLLEDFVVFTQYEGPHLNKHEINALGVCQSIVSSAFRVCLASRRESA